MSDFDLEAYLGQRRRLVDSELERRLVELPAPLARLREAMAYALLSGGKRLRPIFCLGAAEVFGAGAEAILPAACALEFIHAYSLIHDDLPAMDDDDLRRGQPTCHKVFGEAMAILAGDALLTEAFSLLAGLALIHPPQRVVEVIEAVACAAGAQGMVGGQTADLLSEGRVEVSVEEVEFVHRLKTGALITVSMLTGAKLAGAEGDDLAAMEKFGRNIGAAFQITDDLLNIEGRTEIMGKPTGSDAAKGKATYPSAVGAGAARQRAQELVQEGFGHLGRFPAANHLRVLAKYIISRAK